MGTSKESEDWGRGGSGALTSFPSPPSSDYEFSFALSPSSKHSSAQLCPADELFYMGQLLPLQLSPRLSMVRTLLLASYSTSSSSDGSSITGSRDSNGSSSSSFSADALSILQIPECDSSRPSSVTEEETSATKRRYLSSLTTRFSSVFIDRGSKKDSTISTDHNASPSSKKPTNSTTSAKEMIKKYVKKVKPLYDKISSLQHQPCQQLQKKKFYLSRTDCRTEIVSSSDTHAQSFSENLRCPRRMKCTASCPSSMRTSPSHSFLLSSNRPSVPASSTSSREELQSAIQGAIAHCKSTIMLAKHKKSMGCLKEDRSAS